MNPPESINQQPRPSFMQTLVAKLNTPIGTRQPTSQMDTPEPAMNLKKSGIHQIHQDSTTPPFQAVESTINDQELASRIHFGSDSQTHGNLTESSQSGAIMKVLLENGFRQRFDEGMKRGHTYSVIHVPKNPNFVLIDTWPETITENGTAKTITRRQYQSFAVTLDPTKEPAKKPLSIGLGSSQETENLSVLEDLESDLDSLINNQ